MLRSATTSSNDDDGETSPSSTSSDLARKLQGIWIADYARSSGRAKLLSAMGLSGLQRVTAEKLIEGVSLSVSNSSSFVASFLTVVPFFNVTEAVPLDGSSVDLPRRDLKPGSATVSVETTTEAGGGGGGTRLVVVSEWEEGGGGSGAGSGSVVSLRETYKLVKPTELHVEACLSKGANGKAPVASSTTVYR